MHDLGKITVVGESMHRVKGAARFLNASDNLYDGFKAYNKMVDMGKLGKVGAEVIGKGHNAAWLFGKLRRCFQGCHEGDKVCRLVYKNGLRKAVTHHLYLGTV